MKTSLFTTIPFLTALFLTSCSKQESQSGTLHENHLLLKQPLDGQIYGVSQIWSQKGQRYALVTNLSDVEEVTGNGKTTTTFKYDNETIGVMKVDGNIPTSSEKKISFLKRVKGRWEFKD